MLVAISSWSPAARNGLFLYCYRSFNKHLLRSLGIFLNGDLSGCSINGDALAGGDALCGSCDSDDCRDAILAGHDSAVGDGPAHFHDQPASREEEWGPAGIGRGGDQDFTGGQMRTRWIEDHARPRCNNPGTGSDTSNQLRVSIVPSPGANRRRRYNVSPVFIVLPSADHQWFQVHLGICRCSFQITKLEKEDIADVSNGSL